MSGEITSDYLAVRTCLVRGFKALAVYIYNIDQSIEHETAEEHILDRTALLHLSYFWSSPKKSNPLNFIDGSLERASS